MCSASSRDHVSVDKSDCESAQHYSRPSNLSPRHSCDTRRVVLLVGGRDGFNKGVAHNRAFMVLSLKKELPVAHAVLSGERVYLLFFFFSSLCASLFPFSLPTSPIIFASAPVLPFPLLSDLPLALWYPIRGAGLCNSGGACQWCDQGGETSRAKRATTSRTAKSHQENRQHSPEERHQKPFQPLLRSLSSARQRGRKNLPAAALLISRHCLARSLSALSFAILSSRFFLK